ncbi:MAG: XdhC family protein [Candidatus Adiutrix sp.]|jgi:xanthine dehydrogenase accessory factor|nr:XdhC family protein [Candidatus Adiutrix sp.]
MVRWQEQLFQSLKAGREALLVTRLNPDGVVKTVFSGDWPPEWADKHGDAQGLHLAQNGRETTLVEFFLPKPRLIILGGGHIALPLVPMAALLRFEVTVFDDRPSFANPGRFPAATQVICESFDHLNQYLPLRQSDYVVIVTRGHQHDQDCLRQILAGEVPYYVGMIGSRRRVAIVRRQLLEEGFAPEKLERLHSPIGLSIGAVTPEEISVSILGEVIKEKRQPSAPRPQANFIPRGENYADLELLEWLARPNQDPAALVTVVATQGSTPREAGAKMAVIFDGRTVGSIGGGCAEADVMRDARALIHNGGHAFKTIDLTDSAEEDGMVCGGTMEVLIESL